MTSAEDWISALPHELAAQRALLHRLLAAVRVDQQWDWLVQDPPATPTPERHEATTTAGTTSTATPPTC